GAAGHSQPREVDEAVPRGDERGKVVAAVRVPLEELRADDLADGGDEHERRDARAVQRVESTTGEQQRSPCDGAERRRAGGVDAAIDEERGDDIGGRREGEATRAG